MKKLLLAILLLSGVSAFSQAPVLRQKYTTNTAPVVDALIQAMVGGGSTNGLTVDSGVGFAWSFGDRTNLHVTPLWTPYSTVDVTSVSNLNFGAYITNTLGGNASSPVLQQNIRLYSEIGTNVVVTMKEPQLTDVYATIVNTNTFAVQVLFPTNYIMIPTDNVSIQLSAGTRWNAVDLAAQTAMTMHSYTNDVVHKHFIEHKEQASAFSGILYGNGAGLTNLFYTPTNTLAAFTTFPVGSWFLGNTNHFLFTGISGATVGLQNIGEIITVGIRYVTNPPSMLASDRLTGRWTTNGVFSMSVIPGQVTNFIIYNP